MSENGIGGVLAAATVLPATSAAGVFLLNRAHPLVIAGFMGINILALALVTARVTRYFINRK